MTSIEEIFDNSNQLIDRIHHFFDRYIGSALLRKCGIHKIVDKIIYRGYEYADGPLLRLLGKNLKESSVLQKIVKAKDLLIDKILLCFASGSAYRMFRDDKFYGDYGKDTFYRFDHIPTANWERLEASFVLNVIQDIVSRTSADHTNVLIFVDSLNKRSGGKGTALCGKVFDNNDHKMRIGFRIYSMRWQIENAYKDLKYTVDLLHFHGKSKPALLPEVFCLLIMFNFSAYICVHADTLNDI